MSRTRKIAGNTEILKLVEFLQGLEQNLCHIDRTVTIKFTEDTYRITSRIHYKEKKMSFNLYSTIAVRKIKCDTFVFQIILVFSGN